MMNSEEEKRCPLCAEEMDWTDQQFMPCKCGYQICVWCWHHIIDMAAKDNTEGRCPACRSIYEKDKVVAMQANCERTMTKISNRKTKPPKAVKPKTNDVKKDLTNVRVIQRKMAYVIGLPLSLADEDILLRKEYFGQYGKVTKVSLSRTAGGAIQQFVNDTCSAYITYSKEEEALRCIQSVHGFVLEGRYLRASFGTAKYCHAWLKNMPCNNPSCLYLHSVGADEDSFGKDEVAAVHTRSRVQQIVGAANNAAKRSGNVLPPADDMYNSTCTSVDKSAVRTGISDACHGSANSICDMTYPLPCKEKEGAISVPHKMTTFVDIVGRPNCVATEKDENSPEDRRLFDLCSKLSSVTVSGDVHTGDSYSVPTSFTISSPNCSGNGMFKYMPDEPLRNDSLSSNNQESTDTCGPSYGPFSLHPYPANLSENSGHRALSSQRTYGVNDCTADWSNVYNQGDEAALPTQSVNSVLNDSCQDLKFQNSAKSDRVYRNSRSFSNEEIVEHLRRIDGDKLTTDVESSALDAVESSIISNILSMDFDSGEDSLTVPNPSSGLLDETYCYGGSSWSSINSDQSGYSFVKQDGYPAGSILPEYGNNKEMYMCKSQHPVNRGQCFAPPGFSAPCRDPPPGFSSADRAGSLPRVPSASPLPNSSSFSTRLNTGIDNMDLFDPSILNFVKGKQANGFNNLGFGARPLGPQRLSVFDDESSLWYMMQQQQAHQDSKFSQLFTPQSPSTGQEGYTGHLRNRLLGLDDIYTLSSRVDPHQSFFTDAPQQQYTTNGHIPIPIPHNMDEAQRRYNGEVGMAEVASNERLGGAGANKYLARHGDVMLNSGDVYTRVLGL